MKFLRSLLVVIVCAASLAGLIALAAISPPVQTWIAGILLARPQPVQGSVEYLSASFGRAEVTNLSLASSAFKLTIPSLDARVPVAEAVLHRRAGIESLTAKGWTLEVTGTGSPGDSPAPDPAVQVPQAVGRLLGALLGSVSGWRSPVDLALDGLEAEGDVLLPKEGGGEPLRVHLVVTGGGLSQGHPGAFSFTATAVSADSGMQATTVEARGTLTATLDTPRTLGGMGVSAAVSVSAPSVPGELRLAAQLDVARGVAEETYRLSIGTGDRMPLVVAGSHSPSSGKLKGTWTIDLREADLAPFLGDHPLPAFRAVGSGEFSLDGGFKELGAQGEIGLSAPDAGAFWPRLAPLGPVALRSRFSGSTSGDSMRLDRLSIAVSGPQPALEIEALQPVLVGLRTGELGAFAPGSGILSVSAKAMPLRWLSGFTGGLSFPEGSLTGAFELRREGAGFSLVAGSDFAAEGVSIALGRGLLARDLALSFPVSAAGSPEGPWKVQVGPLIASRKGHRLGSLSAAASAAKGEPAQFSCDWSLDAGGLGSGFQMPLLGEMPVTSASGQVTATVQDSFVAQVKVLLKDADPADTASADLHVDVDPDGSAAFLGPVEITTASGHSEVNLDGTLSWGSPESQVSAKLTGGKVSLEQVAGLAAPFLGREAAPGAPPSAFWGRQACRVAFRFDALTIHGREFADAAGTLDADRSSLRLEGGRFSMKPQGLAHVEGVLHFDPAARIPYSLTAGASVAKLDAGPYFSASQYGQGPMLEGSFALEAAATASGADPESLLAGSSLEVRLHSENGIFRLLEASIADTIPEKPAPVKDALSSVGSAVGTFFGRRPEPSYELGKNTVSGPAESVISFTNEVNEIGYETMNVLARLGPGPELQIGSVELSSREVSLTGSGLISLAGGCAPADGPLSLHLRLGASGRVAELLSKAGLLSQEKSSDGWRLMKGDVVLGGTLKAIDSSRWHDMLAAAANPKPAAPAKPN